MARWRWVCVGVLLVAALQQADAQAPPRRRSGPPRGPARENLVEKFDADEDGRLNDEERAAALAHARKNPAGMPPFMPAGDPEDKPVVPGRPTTLDEDVAESERLAVGETAPLYDDGRLRTLFLRFADDDWYDQLGVLYHTEVDVPATLIVDGETYADVGVRFRGNSSYFMTRESLKKSWNISLDWQHKRQRLHGYRTLNLLNSHEDPSSVREVLFSEIGRDYTPAPEANHVRLVVNGEDWGVYVNVQQFNSDYTRAAFGSKGGTRWKIPANPKGGDGGLSYLGPDPAEYKEAYRLLSKDSESAWAALVELCETLGTTPDDELVDALDPIFDIDGALRHLAMENVFGDHDGYLSRASDYNLYLDPDGRFHLVPHDSNETFRDGGRGGGPSSLGDTKQIDPFLHADNEERPVIRRLLGIRRLRARYAAHVRTIVDEWLSWDHIGPRVEAYHGLIDAYVEADAKQLYTHADFLASTTEEITVPMPAGGLGPPPGFGPPPGMPPFGPGDAPKMMDAKPSDKEPTDAGNPDASPRDRRGGGRGRRPGGGERGGPGGRRGSGPPTTPGLRTWVEARRAHLLTVSEVFRSAPEIDGVPSLSDPLAGRATTVTVVPAGEVAVAEAYLHHATERTARYASVPMRSTGGAWSGDILAQPGESDTWYYVELRGANGATAFVPARGEAWPLTYGVAIETAENGGVVINEIMALNEAAHADPQGDFDDWIELANTTDSPIDLTGHFLSDSASKPTKWAFPDGATIAAGGYLVVWADKDEPGDGAEAGLHAGFQLSADGESVLLVRQSDGVPIVMDRVDFGEQSADASTGRSPDGVGEFTRMAPTPGSANASK